ncbi:hypothetical protein OVN20_13325 [Microcella daejeonensis]|jgi:hypothetical protein|uniref:hypothetical protein n=1 Tax=Microcella daejeonensis TaxID=2994971 RepID=UPI00226F28BB|nr:hypothetical protein [Microcella daejeonensis]WAB83990.1 hypothetical protein OVN20_13325 [Microcella daejeonensis]
MSSRPAPPARRRGTDPRLAIGIALVIGSIAAVVGIVAVGDEGIDVYAAPALLTAGERVTADDLELRRVALGAEAATYLTVEEMPEEGVVVARTIGEGELVPRAAVGDARGPGSTTVVVALTTPLGATVRSGDTLDLWASPQEEAGRFGAPVVIASEAQLVREVAEEGIVAGAEAARVELLVPRRDVARILGALANGDALAAVPTALAIGG